VCWSQKNGHYNNPGRPQKAQRGEGSRRHKTQEFVCLSLLVPKVRLISSIAAFLVF
jgi:hypothetical protein